MVDVVEEEIAQEGLCDHQTQEKSPPRKQGHRDQDEYQRTQHEVVVVEVDVCGQNKDGTRKGDGGPEVKRCGRTCAAGMGWLTRCGSIPIPGPAGTARSFSMSIEGRER